MSYRVFILFTDKLHWYYLLNRDIMPGKNKVSSCWFCCFANDLKLKYAFVWFRELKLLPLQWPEDHILPKKQRYGTRQLSEDQSHYIRPELQRISWELWENIIPSTSTLALDIHWAVSLPSRPSRTTIPLYSWFTRELTSKWSKNLAKIFTKLRLERLTHSSLQRVKRKPTLLLPLTKTLLMLPIESKSCEQCYSNSWTPI